jgi:membrane protease YdiL (CAAX protease family)
MLMRDWLQQALWNVVPDDQAVTPSALRRRQVVTVGVIAVGAVVLGVSLRIEPGSVWFYPATTVLALIWMVGAVASGPLPLGRIAGKDRLRRPIVSPILIGMILAAIFVVGAVVVRQVPVLEADVNSVAEQAARGSLPLLVLITAINGVGEELFFRGAAYAAIARHRVAWTTAAYTATTLATGNAMLTFAAAVLGIVVGLERRASGGILAPILTHVTWSLAMLVALPPLFG